MTSIFSKLQPLSLHSVFKRFPVPILLMALFTFIWIFFTQDVAFERIDWLLRGIVISAYVCVSWVLSREAKQNPTSSTLQSHWIPQIFLSAVICVLFLFADYLLINLWMAFTASLLLLGNAAFHKKVKNNLRVWDFTHKLWAAALFAIVGSIIYFIGINAISYALNTLFNLDIESLSYRVLMPIGLGLLAPIYWLASLPSVDDNQADPSDIPDFVSRAIAFIGAWLLSPLMLIYAVILLAYGAKILFLRSMPNGEVAALTVPFLILGTLTWLLLEAPFLKKLLPVALYKKYWFILSIPATILLCSAVWIRINEFGLTVDRFALVLCVIWAMFLGVWFGLNSNKHRDIRMIPGFAALLLAIGAVLAGQASYANQMSRAKSNLALAGISIEQGDAKAPISIAVLDEHAARRAKNSIRYLLQLDTDRTLKAFQSSDLIQSGGDSSPSMRGFVEPSIESALIERLQLHGIQDDILASSQPIQYGANGLTSTITGFDKIHGPYSSIPPLTGFNTNLSNSLSVEINAETIQLLANGSLLGQVDIKTWVLDQSIENGDINLNDPMIPILNESGRAVSLLIQDVYLSNEKRNPFSDIRFYIVSRGFEN